MPTNQVKTHHKPDAFIIQAADVFITPIKDGKPIGAATKLNTQQVQIEPGAVEQTQIISTMKHNYGSTLKTISQKTEADKVTIQFNYATGRDFAMALGSEIHDKTVEAGSVVDESIELHGLDGYISLPHRKIKADTFELKGAAEATYAEGEDFTIDATAGMIKVISEKLAKETEAKASYEYEGITFQRLHIGEKQNFKVQIRFEGLNASNDKDVSGIMHEVDLAPSTSLNLHSDEPIAPEMTGTIVQPEGKESGFEFDTYN